jgi:cation diffusion facilitator CzcD-associated flavoprotein CzcO
MTMHRVETLVVGAGQAGLAVSRCLTERGADHVVVERGRVAERWRTARWDSLRLITPSWMSRLPGWSYSGTDPDGYMTTSDLAGYLQEKAKGMQLDVVAARLQGRQPRPMSHAPPDGPSSENNVNGRCPEGEAGS